MSKAKAKANPTYHSDAWIDDVYSYPTKKRVELAEDILMDLSESAEMDSTVDAFADPKQFQKLQFVPYIYYVPLNKTLENRVLHMKFKYPTIAQKHKSLPMILALSEEIKGADQVALIDYVDVFPPDVKQILSYGKTLSKMSSSEKKKLVDLLIQGVESYRKENKKGEKGWFSDFLRSNKDYEIIGFALNQSYLNVDPKYGDTKPLWVHGWGTPALLLKHKRFPFIIITGPSLRLDENIFGEKNMVGFTG